MAKEDAAKSGEMDIDAMAEDIVKGLDFGSDTGDSDSPGDADEGDGSSPPARKRAAKAQVPGDGDEEEGADGDEGEEEGEGEGTEGEGEKEKEAEKGAVEEAVVTAATDAPQSVPAELRAKWAEVPAEFREFYAKREKDFLNGTEHYRRAAAYGQELHEAINPYMPYLNSKTYADGRPVPAKEAIQFLLNAEYQLQTGSPQAKAQMFAKLAQDYGVDLSLLPGAGEPIDPNLQPWVQEVQNLKHMITGQQQAQMAAERQKAAAEVQAFAADKTKHPYFDELADDIAKFITAGMGLAEAYERAVWANPATRTKEQSRLDKERDAARAKEAEEKRLKALKLKRQNVKSSETGRRPTAPRGSMDDTLREKLREIQTRE